MKKSNVKLQAVGFPEEDKLGVYRFSYLDDYKPFKNKGKLGVKTKSNDLLVEANFTYVEAFAVEYDVFFIVGNEGKFGLYYEAKEIIPVQYERVVKVSNVPEIFLAYTDVEKNQFDVYWQRGLLAKGCKECIREGFWVKVVYIDDKQELFNFLGNFEVETIIGKGKYDIQLHEDYIIVDDGNPVLYNNEGCKVSEDLSGRYVQYGNYLIHITETYKKFYNRDGKEVDLYKIYEDVVMADEYVLVKLRGHWKLLYSV